MREFSSVQCSADAIDAHWICIEFALGNSVTEPVWIRIQCGCALSAQFHRPSCNCHSPVDETSFTKVAPVVQQLLEVQCPTCNQLNHLSKLTQHKQSDYTTHIHGHKPTAHEIINQPATGTACCCLCTTTYRGGWASGDTYYRRKGNSQTTHASAYNFTIFTS